MSSEPSSYAESRNEGRYSLYSTDTDDQVTLAHRGLDRCAALLKTLLSPDSTPKKKPVLSGGGGGSSKKGDRKEAADSSGKHTPFKPSFPGASRHKPGGHATSVTLATRHRRSKTAPVDIAEPSRQARGNTGPSMTSKALHNPVRTKGKSLSRDRTRRRSDSLHRKGAPSNSATTKGGRTAVGGSQLVLGRSQGRQKVPARAHAGEHSVSLPEGTVKGVPQEKVQWQLPKETYFRGPHSVDATAPHLLGTSSPYFSAPLPSSLVPAKHPWLYSASGPPHLCTESLTAKLMAGHPGSATPLPHQSTCAHKSSHPYMQGTPMYPMDSAPLTSQTHGFVFKSSSYPPCTTTYPSSVPHDSDTENATTGTQPGVDVAPQYGNSRKRRHSKIASELTLGTEGVAPYASLPGALLLLVQEMQHSLQHSLQQLKEPVSVELKDKIEKIERSQSHYQGQLATFCRQLGTSEGTRDRDGLSTADWLAQIQQIELDKAHMLERVIQSEMAFSEARQELDQVRREVAVLRSEQEARSDEFTSVKNDLLTATEAIVEFKKERKAAEEELENVRSLYNTAKSQLKQEAKNSAQLKSEIVRSETDLLAVKRSLEAAQEDIGMMRLSLTEKETELVQAQVQMLGLRQCLAYFLSEPVKLGGSEVPMKTGSYWISEEAMKRLETLVNDGNMDSFLGAYTSTVKDDTASLSSSTTPTPTPSCSHQLQNSPVAQPRQPTKQQSNEKPVGSLQQDRSSGLEKEPISSEIPRRDSPRSYHHIQLGLSRSQSEVVKPGQGVESDANNSVTFDLQSLITTSTEVEFQRDLASLDADIARLQLQFSVACQGASY